MICKAGVQRIFLGWLIFKAKRLDEIIINMCREREREGDEIRKMGGIDKGDRATLSCEEAGEPRVRWPGSLGDSVSRRL